MADAATQLKSTECVAINERMDKLEDTLRTEMRAGMDKLEDTVSTLSAEQTKNNERMMDQLMAMLVKFQSEQKTAAPSTAATPSHAAEQGTGWN